eukprot:305820-Prymnesium_polylepis.1
MYLLVSPAAWPRNMSRKLAHVPVALDTARSGARAYLASVTFSIESKEVITPSTIGKPPLMRTGELRMCRRVGLESVTDLCMGMYA